MPINSNITISGKIRFYNNRYQITNPTHISKDENSIKKINSKYKLTEGLSEKKYNQLIHEVLKKIPDLEEWLSDEIRRKFKSFLFRRRNKKFFIWY